MKFNSQLNTSGREPTTCDTPVSHSYRHTHRGAKMWNQYRRTIAGEDPKSNHVEAANRKIYAELGMNHPIIWKFIHGIRKIQRGYDAYMNS